MSAVQFFVANASGLVVRTGICEETQVAQQATGLGETVQLGRATPGLDRIASSGAIAVPTSSVPFTLVDNDTAVIGLPNPTNVNWGAQSFPFRTRTGRFDNVYANEQTFTFSSPGFQSVSVVLLPNSILLPGEIVF